MSDLDREGVTDCSSILCLSAAEEKLTPTQQPTPTNKNAVADLELGRYPSTLPWIFQSALGLHSQVSFCWFVIIVAEANISHCAIFSSY